MPQQSVDGLTREHPTCSHRSVPYGTRGSGQAWGSARAALSRAGREVEDLQRLLGPHPLPVDDALGDGLLSQEDAVRHAAHVMRRLVSETLALEHRLAQLAPAVEPSFPSDGDDEVLPH
uniref:Uncharacterized protein n=1 Tax=Magnetococcus massalia (strain MO-1) TaxID=451514 RepID=A0A1S7LPK1_MAGMO|nr:Protein of unknown function [Candidatus Magnetococcus massalia]